MRHLVTVCGGTTVILASILVVAFDVTTSMQARSPVDSIVVGALWPLLIGCLVGFGLVNHFPTIWTSEQGVEISAFFVMRVMVRWDDIIDVRHGRWTLRRYFLVRARRITLMHRLYGWLYSRTIYPAFVIDTSIEHCDELLAEIQCHIGARLDVT